MTPEGLSRLKERKVGKPACCRSNVLVDTRKKKEVVDAYDDHSKEPDWVRRWCMASGEKTINLRWVHDSDFFRIVGENSKPLHTKKGRMRGC